jgi:membrane protein DedA with SNARE-associated domain
VTALALAAINLEHLGYPLLALLVAGESAGLGLPGETGMVVAGVLAHEGRMDIGIVLLIGVCAAIVGDNVGYLIGRHGGRRLLEHPGPLHRQRLMILREGEPFFEKHGPKAVFFGRWIPVVRVAAVWLAGINQMPWRRFLVWNALGGICWAFSISLLGYYVGSAVIELLHEIGFGAAGVVAMAIIALVVRHLLHRRRHRAVRAEVEAEISAEAPPATDA